MSDDKKIGPKERWRREMREAKFNNRPKPSASELRTKIAKVKPKIKPGGKRGR